MVDGIIEEKYTNRSGLLSRLFAWSPEEDVGERHIQMAPIDSGMWEEFQNTYHDMVEEDEESKVVISVPGKGKTIEKEVESEVVAKEVESEVVAKEVESEVVAKESEESEGGSGSEEESEKEEESGSEEESEEGSEDDDSDSASESTQRIAGSNPYELTLHETKCIESVLECIEKCRLDLLFSASEEWSNTTLLSFIDAAVHLAESPYRRTSLSSQP